MKNLHIAHGLFILILCYAYVFTFYVTVCECHIALKAT